MRPTEVLGPIGKIDGMTPSSRVNGKIESENRDCTYGRGIFLIIRRRVRSGDFVHVYIFVGGVQDLGL